MATVTEIAPDTYRISVFVPEFNLQFNHFLVKDDEPLLFHTGYRGYFQKCVREWRPSWTRRAFVGSASVISSRMSAAR